MLKNSNANCAHCIAQIKWSKCKSVFFFLIFQFWSDEDDTDKDGVTSLSSASPIPAHEIYEHIVKSPPEPTRVKSPEQILMRSPDPVNWIVPLDTGKTFTVTQNIRNGK